MKIACIQLSCGEDYNKNFKQVNNWLKVLSQNFGNSKLDEVVIPSFDCRWNFASSIMNS